VKLRWFQRWVLNKSLSRVPTVFKSPDRIATGKLRRIRWWVLISIEQERIFNTAIQIWVRETIHGHDRWSCAARRSDSNRSMRAEEALASSRLEVPMAGGNQSADEPNFRSFSPILTFMDDGVHDSPEFLLPDAWSSRFELLNSRNWFTCVAMPNTITGCLLSAVRLSLNSWCWWSWAPTTPCYQLHTPIPPNSIDRYVGSRVSDLTSA
jgi:hypothetical protein